MKSMNLLKKLARKVRVISDSLLLSKLDKFSVKVTALDTGTAVYLKLTRNGQMMSSHAVGVAKSPDSVEKGEINLTKYALSIPSLQSALRGIYKMNVSDASLYPFILIGTTSKECALTASIFCEFETTQFIFKQVVTVFSLGKLLEEKNPAYDFEKVIENAILNDRKLVHELDEGFLEACTNSEVL